MRRRHIDGGAYLICRSKATGEGAFRGVAANFRGVTRWSRLGSKHLRLVASGATSASHLAEALHAGHDVAAATSCATHAWQVQLVEDGGSDCGAKSRIRVLRCSHVVASCLLVLLLQSADLLLASLEIGQQSIVLRLELLDLMLQIGHLSVKSCLLSLMREH